MDEISWIEFLKREFKSKNIFKGIGDDCAIIKKGSDFYLFTNDLFIENIHFKKGKISFQNLGKRAIARSISDIVACGGIPQFISISLGIRQDLKEKDLKKIVKGIKEFSQKYKLRILGGDTSKSSVLFLDVFAIGKAKKVILRSGAKEGDYIFLTGALGKLAFDEVPSLRIREIQNLIKKYKINAMIDISDGFFLDLYRLLKESRKGSVIYKDNLPIEREEDLFRGEDYELIFVVDKKEDINFLKRKYFFVGIIKEEGFGYKIKEKDKIVDMPLKGFLHF